jgi:hypothetical protein
MRIALNNAFRVAGQAIQAQKTRNPFSLFTYDVDFVAGTAKGGTQPYGGNSNDGRLFRDPSNVTATFCPNASGTLSSVSAAGLRRTTKGVFSYMSSTNAVLWNRDLTNAAWTKTNMTASKTATGADGSANAATRLTATASTATVTQAFTSASAQRVFSLDIKRVTGTGNITLSVDGGTTRTVLTGLTTSYTQQWITQAAVTNPTIEIQIATSGDVVDVDLVQLCTPSISGLNIPTPQRYATTSATVINSQSRPNVASADAGPLYSVSAGAFGFYWQGRSERPTGGFVITSDATLFCNVTGTGALRFSLNPGASQTADGVWRTGLGNLNKVAGWVKADGTLKVACNGQLGGLGTGGVLNTGGTHWDLGTNGSGANSIMGINERFAIGSGLVFSDAELVSMTT